jgi:putative addiction module component (TIGR02574 family)
MWARILPVDGLTQSKTASQIKGRACSSRINRVEEIPMADLEELLSTAMRLSVDKRAALAERLLASLDDLDEAESDRIWAEEAQRRLAGFRAGRARAVPARTVHERAEKLPDQHS